MPKRKTPGYNYNPTGKGGFKDHPEHINRKGAPRKGESIAEVIRFYLNGESEIEVVGSDGKRKKERYENIALLVKTAFQEAIQNRRGWAFRFLASYGYGFPAQSSDQAAASVDDLVEALDAADEAEQDSEALQYIKEIIASGNGNGSGGNGNGK